jgi:hypothetical protein
MSAVVKLSSKLPGETEINGVDAMVDLLTKDPETLRVGVVVFDVSKVEHDTDTGDDIPTIRLRRLEPLSNVDNMDPQLRALVDAAAEQRTGKKALPFEQVEVLDADDQLPEDDQP